MSTLFLSLSFPPFLLPRVIDIDDKSGEEGFQKARKWKNDKKNQIASHKYSVKTGALICAFECLKLPWERSLFYKIFSPLLSGEGPFLPRTSSLLSMIFPDITARKKRRKGTMIVLPFPPLFSTQQQRCTNILLPRKKEKRMQKCFFSFLAIFFPFSRAWQ